MDKWITSLLTCVFRQNSPAACRVRPAKSVFGRHSPAGWQFPRRTACFAPAAFCRLPFSAAGRFPARPIDRQNAGFAYFLVRRCKPVPRGGRMSANSQDGGQTSRKTADKRLARRWTNVLRQNRRRGRRTAAWAKRAVLANGAAYALKSDGFFAKCIALHPLRFQSPRRFAGPQPPLYPQLRFRIRFRIRKHKKRRA